MDARALKKDWALNQDTFRRFLAWLDEDVDSGGQKYLEMRRRLVAYFDRKNCLTPDELADATMTRVARKLEELGVIETETPAKYCYITARFVFLEHLRTQAKERQLRSETPAVANAADEDGSRQERMLACLEQCAAGLDPANRELILRYYEGTQRAKIDNRRALAAELGTSLNALAIRACRIRDQLEHCVRQSMGPL